VPARHPSPRAESSGHTVKRRTVRCAPARPGAPIRLTVDGEPAHVGDAGWWLETDSPHLGGPAHRRERRARHPLISRRADQPVSESLCSGHPRNRAPSTATYRAKRCAGSPGSCPVKAAIFANRWVTVRTDMWERGNAEAVNRPCAAPDREHGTSVSEVGVSVRQRYRRAVPCSAGSPRHSRRFQ
jgi:hypothetical protein